MDYGNAVVCRQLANAEVHRLGAGHQVGRRHKAARLPHRQPDGELHRRRRVGSHRKDGMHSWVTRVAFGNGQACWLGGDADEWHIVVKNGHCGCIARRLGHFVAGVGQQSQRHRALHLVDIVILNGDAVVSLRAGGGDGHRLDSRSARSHEVTSQGHRQPDSQRLRHRRIGPPHREHNMLGRVARVALGQA